MGKTSKLSTAVSTASPQNAPTSSQALVLRNSQAALMRELTEYRALLEKQDRAREALAKLTKDAKAKWEAVLSAFAVAEAHVLDPVPNEVDHG